MNISRNIWTPEEEALLRELFPDHKNTEIAVLMGRSFFSVRSKAEKLGLTKSDKFWRETGPVWTDAEKAYVAEHYANSDTNAIAAHLGRSPKAVILVAHRLGLHKSEEYISASNASVSKKAHASKSAEQQAEWNKKTGEAIHRLYQSERRRALFGLAQRTRMKIRCADRKKGFYMYHLKRDNGYHIFPESRSRVYYSDSTRRSKRLEQYAERVYHLRFSPLSDRDYNNSI